MRSMILAAIAALAFAGAANAAGPYKLDAKGNCHDVSGKFATKTLCGPAPAKHCTTGKLCGNSCIKKTDVCHKPG